MNLPYLPIKIGYRAGFIGKAIYRKISAVCRLYLLMKYLPPTFATKNIVIKTSSEEKMNRLLFGMMLLAVGCLAGSCTDDDEYTQGVWGCTGTSQ